jgi:hypothetical protein
MFVDSYRSKSVAKNPDFDHPITQMNSFQYLKLALGYRSRVGKDTAADTIVSAYGGHVIRFAEPVYDTATKYLLWLKGTAFKHPGLLQVTGELMRNSNNRPVKVAERKIREIELYGVFMRHNWGFYTPIAALIKATYNKCTGKYIGGNVVVVDMRYSDEMEMLKSHEFETVKISRGDYNKVVDRDTTHISEWGLDTRTLDHHWENNSSIDNWKTYVIDRCEEIVKSKHIDYVADNDKK